MKIKLLTILTISLLIFNTKAQVNDRVAFRASQQEVLPQPGTIPPKFASIQTLAGSNLRLTGDWTIEAWVKIIFPANQIHIVETYGAGNTGGLLLRLKGNKVQAYQITNPTSSNTVLGTTVITAGE